MLKSPAPASCIALNERRSSAVRGSGSHASPLPGGIAIAKGATRDSRSHGSNVVSTIPSGSQMVRRRYAA